MEKWRKLFVRGSATNDNGDDSMAMTLEDI